MFSVWNYLFTITSLLLGLWADQQTSFKLHEKSHIIISMYLAIMDPETIEHSILDQNAFFKQMKQTTPSNSHLNFTVI